MMNIQVLTDKFKARWAKLGPDNSDQVLVNKINELVNWLATTDGELVRIPYDFQLNNSEMCKLLLTASQVSADSVIITFDIIGTNLNTFNEVSIHIAAIHDSIVYKLKECGYKSVAFNIDSEVELVVLTLIFFDTVNDE